jgi:hypothetical protein
MSVTAVTVARDIFLKGLPLVIRRLMKTRLQQAQDVLLEELEIGNATSFDIADTDEVAAMVFEFATAAQRGTAKRNLRLIAQVMAGAIVSTPVYADDFLRWANDLSSLSREEIVALGVMFKNDERAKTQALKDDVDRINFAYTATRVELIGPEKLCATDEQFNGLFGALVRTGLVIPWPGFDNLVYSSSEKLRRLMKVADIDRVVDGG